MTRLPRTRSSTSTRSPSGQRPSAGSRSERRVSLQAPRRDEYPLDAVAGPETVEAISDRLAACGSSVRAAIELALELADQDTADLFIEVSRAIDKHLWFVEAHLQP